MRLIRDNVERIVTDEKKISQLKAEGFKEVIEKPKGKGKKAAESGEDNGTA